VGAGLDFQHIDAQFNQDVGLGDLSLPGLPDDTDTQSMNDASDWAWGWHAGILYQFTPSTRVGLAYHSKVNVNADGTSTLKGPLSTIATGGASDKIVSNDLTSQVTLPAFTTLSIYHDINDRWAVMGSVNYTQWNVFGNIPLDNAAAIAQAGLSFVPATTDVDVPQNFHNTWRVATGVNYRASEKWLLRAGAGVDEDPTNNTDRNVRLPDATRYNVAIGAHYQANKRIGIDAGWTHLFVPDAIINQGQAVAQQYTYVNGTSENSGNIIGAQLTWNIT
jgi:long-chain fatty acid transport protein